MIKNEEVVSCVEIESNLPAKRSVIWLHGLGADGNDFVPLVSVLQLPATLAVRFIFPHAPVIPVTINNGYRMRAWYDIVTLTAETHMDKTGMMSSKNIVEQLIAKENARGIESKNILLAGFSQGAVIAFLTGLSYSEPLAGIMALSGYLPFAKELLANASKDKYSMPIFVAHGKQDSVVSYEFGKTAFALLKNAGFNVTFHSYPMAHAVCEEEIRDISEWLQTLWSANDRA